jgi:hypothetical protein
MYVMNYITLDIAYSVRKLSRFIINPRMVLKYLKYTLDYELHYTSYLTVLERYSDAN